MQAHTGYCFTILNRILPYDTLIKVSHTDLIFVGDTISLTSINGSETVIVVGVDEFNSTITVEREECCAKVFNCGDRGLVRFNVSNFIQRFVKCCNDGVDYGITSKPYPAIYTDDVKFSYNISYIGYGTYDLRISSKPYGITTKDNVAFNIHVDELQLREVIREVRYTDKAEFNYSVNLLQMIDTLKTINSSDTAKFDIKVKELALSSAIKYIYIDEEAKFKYSVDDVYLYLASQERTTFDDTARFGYKVNSLELIQQP